MRTYALAGLAIGAIVVVSGIGRASGADDRRDDRRHRLATSMSGFNEVHFVAGPPAALRGAVSTTGKGHFEASIDQQTQVIDYALSYSDLEGTVTQSHIHFGQAHTTGGIVVWLCQTTAAPAPATVANLTPVCPAPGGTVTGSITPAQVLAQTAQGIDAGAFDEVVAAIRAGAAYVNVHSSLFAPGEIRGQLGHDHD